MESTRLTNNSCEEEPTSYGTGFDNLVVYTEEEDDTVNDGDQAYEDNKDVTPTTTGRADHERSSDMTPSSSQGYDTEDDRDHHVFVDHQQVMDEVYDVQRMDQAVLELEPLHQSANGRPCRIGENDAVVDDVHDNGKPDDVIDRADSEDGVGGDIVDAEETNGEKENGTRIFIAVKSAYFLLFSGHVSLFPFIPVYLSYLGLGVMEIGKIRALEPFIGMVATPMCGTVADKFSRHKVMLLACLCGTALVYGSSVFLPFLAPESSHMYSKHTQPKMGNYTFDFHDLGQGMFDSFFSHHPHVIAATSSCAFRFLPFSEYFEYVEGSSCNYTTSERLYGSTAMVLVEDIHGCSFTDHSSLVFRGKSDDVTPDVKCLFCDGMMRACTYQYQTTETDQNISRNVAYSLGNSSVTVKMNGTSHFPAGFPGGASKERSLLSVFAIMLMIVIVGEMFAYSSVPLLDASTMTLIDEYKEAGQTFEYGRQRMWGGIAHGLLAPLSGIAVDAYTSAHPDAFNKYLPAFALFASLLALCAATASVIPIRAKPRTTTASFATDAKGFLLKPKVVLFFFVMFITGILVGFINTYLFLFLAEIHGGVTVMGLTLTGTCAAEVPFMMFSSKLIEKFGHRGVIGIALFGFVLRFVGYSLLWNPWAVIPVELLHGVTYGSLWPASTSYIHHISPPDMTATMQSLTYSIRGGLGKGLGTILGGVIYHNFGARNLFRGSAILSLLTLIFYCVISLILDRREKHQEYDKF